MALPLEKEPTLDVDERAQEASDLTIERRQVVQAIPTRFSAQVTGQDGGNLIQTPQTQAVTIQIPTDDDSLKKLSKGSIGDAITCFALFWLRMIKKALHFGWRVVVRSK